MGGFLSDEMVAGSGRGAGWGDELFVGINNYVTTMNNK
jgi:hypothetical protein